MMGESQAIYLPAGAGPAAAAAAGRRGGGGGGGERRTGPPPGSAAAAFIDQLRQATLQNFPAKVTLAVCVLFFFVLSLFVHLL